MQKQIVAYSYYQKGKGSGVEVRYWVDAFEEKKSGHHALRID